MDEQRFDNVGESIFTDGNGITIADNEQTKEEAEAQEDQRRRQEELQNLLVDAFDDIGYDEDNSTANSSFDASADQSSVHSKQDRSDRFLSETRPPQQSSTSTDEAYRNTSFNGMEQLQLLYQVRVREVAHLTEQLAIIQEQSMKETDLLKKKILLLQSENEGVKLSLQQSQNLLVERSREIQKNADEIVFLKDFLENLKDNKQKSENELHIWKTKAHEFEQKLNLYDKGLQTNVSERQIRGRYEHEISDLQTKLENYTIALEQSQKSNASLQNELQAIKLEKEFLLIEKGEVVNSLSKCLEESQSQCHNLMNKVSSLELEYQKLEHSMKSTFRRDSGQKYNESSLCTLNQELKRSLEDQKKKREEIAALEMELRSRTDKEYELLSKLQSMEVKAAQFSSLVSENQSLREKNIVYMAEIEGSRMTLNELDKRYTSTADNYEIRINDLINQNDKLVSENHDLQIVVNRSEIWKDQYNKYESLNHKLQESVAQMTVKLSESKGKIAELNEKLILKEERDNLIEELQEKAMIFEKYIETNVKDRPVTANQSTNTEINQYKLQSELEKVNSEYSSLKVSVEKLLFEIQKLEHTIETKQEELKVSLDENVALKKKIIFDRNALSELTNIWNDEVRRLEGIVKQLNEQIDVQDERYKQKKIIWTDEFNRLNGLISILTEKNATIEKNFKTLQEQNNIISNQLHDELIKIRQNSITGKANLKNMEQHLRNDYNSKEQHLKSEFEHKERHLKTQYQRKEEHLKSEYIRIQEKFCKCLDEVQQKIVHHLNYSDKKFECEDRIIEDYFGMLARQANLKLKK